MDWQMIIIYFVLLTLIGGGIFVLHYVFGQSKN